MASCSCSKVVPGSRVRLADRPSDKVSLIFLLAGLVGGEWEGALWVGLLWEGPLGEDLVDDLLVGVGETLEL